MVAPIYAAFEELDNVRLVSLIGQLCDEEVCRAVVDGRPLFWDNNHLAFSHSALIANILGE